MYLSRLLIDVGDDPDRPRPGRLWLRNLYHVHQRLCMAFPSASRASNDPEFLRPFKPEDFGAGQVHVERKADSGFLFRVDPLSGARAMIVVQSAVMPDWGYAFQNAVYLLASPVDVKEFNPRFAKGQRLCFRLVANPTRKVDTKTGPDGRRRHGRRVPVRAEQHYEWLAHKGRVGGFEADGKTTAAQIGYVYVNKRCEGQGQRLLSVRYDGLLMVTDPAAFGETIVRGIGSAKGFGFGLLSVTPLRP